MSREDHFDGSSFLTGAVLALWAGTMFFLIYAPWVQGVRNDCEESGRAHVRIAGDDLEILCQPIDWEQYENEAWHDKAVRDINRATIRVPR